MVQFIHDGKSIQEIYTIGFPNRTLESCRRKSYIVRKSLDPAPHARMPQAWSHTDLDLIVRLREQGVSYRDMQSRYFPTRTITQIETRHNQLLSGHRPNGSSHFRWKSEEDETLLRLRKQGRSYDHISRVLPWRSEVAVFGRIRALLAAKPTLARKSSNVRLTSSEKETIKSMNLSGEETSEIARFLGRSYNTVQDELRRNGMPRNVTTTQSVEHWKQEDIDTLKSVLTERSHMAHKLLPHRSVNSVNSMLYN